MSNSPYIDHWAPDEDPNDPNNTPLVEYVPSWERPITPTLADLRQDLDTAKALGVGEDLINHIQDQIAGFAARTGRPYESRTQKGLPL